MAAAVVAAGPARAQRVSSLPAPAWSLATEKALTEGDIPARAQADRLYMLDRQARSAMYP